MPLEVVTKLGAVAARPNIPDDTDETADITISKLVLVGELAKASVNVAVADVLTTGTATDTITGAPQVVINLLDRDYKLSQSGVFGDPVDIRIDTIPYRLVEVSLVDIEQLQLTFEHKIVALLRQHTKALKASRDTMTRAQFIELMLREIAPEFPGLRFVCPEVNTAQPVGAAKKTGRTLKSKTLGSTVSKSVRGSGFGVTHLDIRDWDGSTVTLGPSQLKNASIVLDVCAQLGANAKATLAVVEACIVEPDKPFGNPPVGPGSGGSAGILQWGGGGTTLPAWANDVAQAVTHSLQDPGATGKGGMMSLARNNPGWSAGTVAQREQGSAFGSRYDMAQAGAMTVINAFKNAGGFAATGVTGVAGGAVTTATYEFTRGQSGQAEDSWTCGQRLASEVNWRLFIVGPNAVYFCTDDDLIASEPKYFLAPGTPGVVKPGYDVEVGGRTVVIKGRRQPKPSTAQFEVRVDRWKAPIGTVVELGEWGPADGTWIVTEVDTNLFDADATVIVDAPQKPLPEPAATTTTTGGVTGATVIGPLASSSKNPIDRVYAASAAMSARNLPYSKTAGGHGGDGWAAEIRAPGQDCSSAVSIVLYQAGLMPGYANTIVSGDFSGWMQPGRGTQMTVWYNAGHVFIEFYGRPAKRFDTVSGGSGGSGPHLRFTAPGDAPDTWENSGFAARHVPGF